MDMWDSHKIRPSSNPVVPSGRPRQMYQFPFMWDATDYLVKVCQQKVQACLDCGMTKVRSELACDDDVHRLCTAIMRTRNLDIPEGFFNKWHFCCPRVLIQFFERFVYVYIIDPHLIIHVLHKKT